MTAKLSRYRNVADEVTLDTRGRRTRGKGFRPATAPGGAVRHTLTTADRLDLLAHQYYRQPRKWWRICDANPEFLSPFALLGTEPLVTLRLTLSFTGCNPPWVKLLKRLTDLGAQASLERADWMALAPQITKKGGDATISDSVLELSTALEDLAQYEEQRRSDIIELREVLDGKDDLSEQLRVDKKQNGQNGWVIEDRNSTGQYFPARVIVANDEKPEWTITNSLGDSRTISDAAILTSCSCVLERLFKCRKDIERLHEQFSESKSNIGTLSYQLRVFHTDVHAGCGATADENVTQDAILRYASAVLGPQNQWIVEDAGTHAYVVAVSSHNQDPVLKASACDLRYTRCVVVTYNRIALTRRAAHSQTGSVGDRPERGVKFWQALIDEKPTLGCEIISVIEHSRVGKPILIPPDVAR